MLKHTRSDSSPGSSGCSLTMETRTGGWKPAGEELAAALEEADPGPCSRPTPPPGIEPGPPPGPSVAPVDGPRGAPPRCCESERVSSL